MARPVGKRSDLGTTPPFPALGSEPEGVVIDEHGAAVAGAQVELVASEEATAPFARAIAALLRKQPLPQTSTARDGSFVLPFTPAQRDLGAAGEGEFWLVVRKPGFGEWREPLSTGLAGYLGSRVILRRTRADDPFAALPWPPAFEAAAAKQRFQPWFALPLITPASGRHGAATEADAAAPERFAVRLQVVDEQKRPVPHATLLFANSCWPGSGAAGLPNTTDADGSVADLRLPAGRHTVRVAARGFLAVQHTMQVAGGEAQLQFVALRNAEYVDLLAVDADAQFVPFVELDVVAPEPTAGRRPIAQWADSWGRARVALPERASYFVYADTDGAPERVPLGADGVVRTLKHRPVSVLIRDLNVGARTGAIQRVRETAVGGRGYRNAPERADFAATRQLHRDGLDRWAGGEAQVPLVLRTSELPPPPREPLLDLLAVDRRPRLRAKLALRGPDSPPRRLVAQPSWQGEVVRPATDERLSLARRDADGTWQLWACDEAAYTVVIRTASFRPCELTLPAAAPGAEPPTLTVDLVK